MMKNTPGLAIGYGRKKQEVKKLKSENERIIELEEQLKEANMIIESLTNKLTQEQELWRMLDEGKPLCGNCKQDIIT